MKKALGISILVCAVAFFILNNYIYYAKQGGISLETPTPVLATFPPFPRSLIGTVWVWNEVVYQDGRVVRPRARGAFTLTLQEGGAFIGTTDCNDLNGRYSTRQSAIMFDQIGMTKKGCPDSEEMNFVQLLRDTVSYHFSSVGELVLDLKFDSGSVLFR